MPRPAPHGRILKWIKKRSVFLRFGFGRVLTTKIKTAEVQDDRMIHCRNLTKIYFSGSDKVSALNRLNLSVEVGECVALVGRSGSGKSTLLHILSGMDRPTEGEVEIDGRNLATLSERELIQYRLKEVGVVFQSFHLISHRTAFENVFFITAMFISNSMVMSVIERTTEFGIMKALGASSRQVMGMMLCEGAMIGFIGSVIAATASVIFAGVIELLVQHYISSQVDASFRENVFQFAWMEIRTTAVVAVTFCTIASVFPAFRAARLNPINAMRYS